VAKNTGATVMQIGEFDEINTKIQQIHFVNKGVNERRA
jgi:hypothetical protein